MSAHRRFARSGGLLATLAASLAGVVAYLAPFANQGGGPPAEEVAHLADAPILLLLLAVAMAAALAAEASRDGAAASKTVALLGVLVATNSALRLLPALGGASPIFVLIALTGYVFGPTRGFLMGSLSLLGSAFLTGGVGPWLPYQMLGAGWMGLSAGWLPRWPTHPRLEVALLTGFGGLWGLIYGAILNLWFWAYLADQPLGYQTGSGPWAILQAYGVFYVVTSLWYDLARAIGTAVLTLALGRAVLIVLDRARRRLFWTTDAAVEPPALL